MKTLILKDQEWNAVIWALCFTTIAIRNGVKMKIDCRLTREQETEEYFGDLTMRVASSLKI